MQHLKSMFFQYRGLSRSAYILFLGKMITNMGAFIWPLLTLILSQKIGLSATETAYATTALSIFYLIGSIAGGKIADHFNRKKLSSCLTSSAPSFLLAVLLFSRVF